MREELYRLHQRARQGLLDPVMPEEQARAAGQKYRPAAVLALFAESRGPSHASSESDLTGVDIFLVKRSPNLVHHPGQIALPGGGLDPGETPEVAALREAEEETGVQADSIDLIGPLDEVALPVSGNIVTPVLGWSDRIQQSHHWDTSEVLLPLQVPVADLLNPQNRAVVRLASFQSAGFYLPTGWVWGFTGNLLSYLFDQLGWTRTWDTTRTHTITLDEAHGRVRNEH